MMQARERGVLRVAHCHKYLQDTLGPGKRAVVWVQGCSQHCPGCITPEHWNHNSAGEDINPVKLAHQLLDEDPLANLTVSGGEPTEQADAVAPLLAEAHQLGRNTWVYTGRVLEDLVSEGNLDILDMLSHTDVLVDSPFSQDLAGAFAHKGSSNQRIIRLTDAISEEEISVGVPGKVEIMLNSDGELAVLGIPVPGFLDELHNALRDKGIDVS